MEKTGSFAACLFCCARRACRFRHFERVFFVVFTVEGKRVEVFPAAKPGCPVLYLHTVEDDGGAVYEAVQARTGMDFSLVAVSRLDWNADLSPWAAPAVFAKGAPFSGGAGAYLALLLEKIVPQAESLLPPVSWRGIAGYSLAGLFAVYTLYQTGVFENAACVSGSLWFPGIKAYVLSHSFCKKPRRLSISLGNKECETHNRYMQCVQENTQAIEAFCRSQGIDTVFRLNPGNHFQNAVTRCADGICWVLETPDTAK